MSNSRPIQFLDYACGHSLPVRGSGAVLDRVCGACAAGQTPRPIVGPITLSRMLGHTGESQ